MTHYNSSLVDAALTFDAKTRTYRTQFDWSSREPISCTVITALAELTGREPQAISPLFHTIDPEALDALFRGRTKTGLGSPGEVSFSHAGHDVVVTSDGRIIIDPDPS